MSDDQSQSTTQKHANLARIRDNQRRSRARRKEYLQELESKYRICEQVGVEASAEIQTAARRVIAENKRLRQLLKQQGLSNAEIDEPAEEGARLPNAAHDLERMLGLRKPCKPGRCCGEGGDDDGATAGCELSCASSQSEQQMNLQPESAISSQDVPSSAPHSGVPPYPSPAPPTSMTPPTSQLPSTQGQSYSHLAPSSMGQAYPVQPDNQVAAFESPQGLGWLEQYPLAYFTPAEVDTSAIQTSSSCQVAANVIRGIKPDLGNELEEELCGISNTGDCCVPNDKIFNIMDRYSNGVA